MTLLRSRPGTDGERDTAPPALPAARRAPAVWARDLAMGMRFAAGGGREGWIRTALTAAGVALGVAVLLLGASAPTLMNAWHAREKARENLGQAHPPPPGDRTLLYASANTTFHGTAIRGRLVRPDGTRPPVPPGLDHLPGPGRMVVSPALKELLDSPGAGLLRERLGAYRIAGVIGDEGLQGPRELTYLAQSTTLGERDGYRIDHFGKNWEPRPLTAPATVLVIMTCVALLTPVMVFIGTSVRFGNERRERRLAALRLVGADVRTTRRIASGEALFGSLLGLLGGGLLFLAARQLAPAITLWDINVYSADVAPGPVTALLIAVLVPAAAVLVTLVAQRGVTVEPLGVVRHRPPVRRRLWWRLALPVLSALLLVPLVLRHRQPWDDTPVNTFRLAAGSTLLLFGITALLPWLVERVVGRLRGGPVPWQLAVRRLQLNSGPATRAVSGITVAVAGAIAIHMLMTGMQTGYAAAYAKSGQVPRISFWGHTDTWRSTERALAALRATPGVTAAHGTIDLNAGRMPAPGRDLSRDLPAVLTVGSCAELRHLARLPACKDGDVFVTDARPDRDTGITPGATLNLNPPLVYGEPAGRPRPWTVPPAARAARLLPSGDGHPRYYDLLLTPAALDPARYTAPDMQLDVDFDRGTPDAVEHIRNTAARIGPTMYESSSVDNPHDRQLDGVRTALFTGAVITLLLIGAGLIISTVEQLHERRRLLSVLDAHGTRRATLGWSVLWQTALPVALGLALAVTCGLTLGTLLLTIIGTGLAVDWAGIAGITAIGAAVILFVTALSLPPLWRMMRPDGLRTE
ncbi:ABC transporter permease [Streptomyces sp. RS10V-4]|uniref:ABC transporter permease n=1 Tax=Streptomyces rhizoryzae TaxID=2932493 RepID=UPI002005ACEB|nr:FtsX-like permease family protein [Streptomyces rhizoryzae]MCK7627884.1 ABC transporter permease [Streptomyces rhizoryzae]